MLTVKSELEGQLEFNLFSEDTLTEQLNIFDLMALKNLEEIWDRIKIIYDKNIPISRFFNSIDIFSNSKNERDKLNSVKELCKHNESLVEQYIKEYLC